MTDAKVFKKKRVTEEDIERREIMESIDSLKEDLQYAYSAFNNASAPELVEACVYDINALQARYSYFLRRMKECGGKNETVLRGPR